MGNETSIQTLTEKDFQILMKASGQNEKQIHQWYEDFRAESGQTDRLNKRQFKHYYSRLKHKTNLDQLTDHIFRAFDTDHSGAIDFHEFLLAFIATTEGNNRQKFEYAFEVFDINHDQYIDKKEAEKILNIICRLLGLPKKDAEAYTHSLMVSFDVNHDKVLSKTEFVEGCLSDPTLGELSNPFHL